LGLSLKLKVLVRSLALVSNDASSISSQTVINSCVF